MNFKTILFISLILVILLPISLTILTWRGLEQMDNEIELVIEEYVEIQKLQPVEVDLSVALLVLNQDIDGLESTAIDRLKSAERTMLAYLADQFDGNASDEHQAEEVQHASNALNRLSELISTQWNTLTISERVARIEGIRSDLRDLYEDAESGVQATPAIATQTKRQTLRNVFVVSIAAVTLSLILSVWPTRRVIRRLREIREAVEEQSEGPSKISPKDVSGELLQLEKLNERMLTKIQESSKELLRRERMAGIGLLAADVAHEINNPMNAMLGLSELSLKVTGSGPIDEQGQKELHESLTVIHREVLRCRGIVDRLMAMVRGKSSPELFDVSRLLRETVDVARAARPDKASCYHTIGSGRSIQIKAPQQEIRQILLTLLINAADAISDDGMIEVDATRTDQEVWLRVRDNGRGFTPDMQEGFFVPFSTNRSREGGVGLGLSIASTLSADIGAEIRAFSDGPGKGSMFMLAFPLSEDQR